MKMKKLAIVLTVGATVLTMAGCASLVNPTSGQITVCETVVANQLSEEIRERFGRQKETMADCLADMRERNVDAFGDAFEKGFNRGVNRALARHSQVRYGSFKSKTTLRDGTVIRSKTKYRTGFGGTKIETKYY